jgi:ATP-dependent Clp protease ATP-binding subunit ClpC
VTGLIGPRDRVDLPLSAELKRVLQFAMDESERMKHKHTGRVHLLLGILREDGCFAASLLKERGLSLDSVREAVSGYPGS